MRVLTQESYWNIYLLRGYPEVWIIHEKELSNSRLSSKMELKLWTKMYLQKQDKFNRKCTDGSKKIMNWQMFSWHC